MNNSDYNPESYAAIIPINPAGEVLLGLRTEDGLWTTPAGGADPGESSIDCAIREAKEEAQLDILPQQLELLYTKTTPNGKPITCYLFRCGVKYTNPEYDPDKEVQQWLWLRPENFPKALDSTKNKIRRDTILDALARFHFLSKATELSHPTKQELSSKDALLAYVQSVRVKDPMLAESLYSRLYPYAEEAQDTDLPIKKAIVQMAPHVGANVDTADVAQELRAADPYWLQVLTSGMADYQYGDIPVEFILAKGTLHLSKVDDGMYSGFFQYQTPTLNQETGMMEEMVDNAQVRIESLTLPTLCIFLKAKDWLPEPEVAETTTSPTPADYDHLDRKIKMLELLDRITGKI